MDYNKTELTITDKTQYRGTGIIATNEMVDRIIEKGGDSTKLRRWSWIVIEGRNRQRPRIISCYRPEISSNGSGLVKQQQYCYFTEQKRYKTYNGGHPS